MAKKITKAQTKRAEAFRQELLTGHGIANKRQSGIFSRLIGGLTPESLKKLEGQYAKIDIEPAQKTELIAKDILARTRAETGRATAKNAAKVIATSRQQSIKKVQSRTSKITAWEIISKAGEKRLTDIQIAKAENFRQLLLKHHGITNEKTKQNFENIVKSLNHYELTKLSRQYKDAISVWEDSEGEAVVIAQDLLNRIKDNQGARTIANARKEILKGKTETLTKAAVEQARADYNEYAKENEYVYINEEGDPEVLEISTESMTELILVKGPYGEKYAKQYERKHAKEKKEREQAEKDRIRKEKQAEKERKQREKQQRTAENIRKRQNKQRAKLGLPPLE